MPSNTIWHTEKTCNLWEQKSSLCHFLMCEIGFHFWTGIKWCLLSLTRILFDLHNLPKFSQQSWYTFLILLFNLKRKTWHCTWRTTKHTSTKTIVSVSHKRFPTKLLNSYIQSKNLNINTAWLKLFSHLNLRKRFTWLITPWHNYWYTLVLKKILASWGLSKPKEIVK